MHLQGTDAGAGGVAVEQTLLVGEQAVEDDNWSSEMNIKEYFREVYRLQSTGATLTISNTMALLHRYCQLLTQLQCGSVLAF
jgi:hypothetical protein